MGYRAEYRFEKEKTGNSINSDCNHVNGIDITGSEGFLHYHSSILTNDYEVYSTLYEGSFAPYPNPSYSTGLLLFHVRAGLYCKVGDREVRHCGYLVARVNAAHRATLFASHPNSIVFFRPGTHLVIDEP